ncbi:MAG: iron complex outermembrane receptor protein [Bacteroidia bacterium]|jgi:iron complex outermembrane receptor protein
MMISRGIIGKRSDGPSRTVTFALALFGILSFLPAATHAATDMKGEATKKDSLAIEEIVVTATYRDTAEMDTPLSMMALDNSMIESMGLQNLADLGLVVPSLNVVQTDSSRTNISIRGIKAISGYEAPNQTKSMTSIYIDETPVTGGQEPDRQIGGAMFDLARVEVLNGPQGTLFGEGSMAGTIRYISNQPNLSEWNSKVQVNVNGMSESSDTGYRFDGMVNIPIVEDKFAVRLVGFSTEAPGYLDRQTLAGTTVETDINTETQRGGRLTSKWQATDNLSIKATAYTIESETESYAYSTAPYFVETAPSPFAPGSYDDLKQYNLVFEYAFPGADLLSSTSYFDRDASFSQEFLESGLHLIDFFAALTNNFQLDPVGDSSAPIPITADPQDMRNMTSFAGTFFIDSERFAQEFRLVSNGDGPFGWMAGFFYKDSTDITQRNAPFTLSPATEQFRPAYESFLEAPENSPENSLEEYAVFADVSYELSDTWEVNAGIRYTDMTQKFSRVSSGTEDQKVTPRVGLTWRPNNDMMFFGIVSTGFRPGGYNGDLNFDLGLLENILATAGDINLPTRSGDDASVSQRIADVESKLDFEGDEAINYELGAKLRLFDGRMNLTTSAFYFDWKDAILLQDAGDLAGITSALTYNANVGEAHSFGFDMNASGMVTERLFLRLGVQWVEAEIDSAFQPKGGLAQAKGNRLPDAPKLKWSVSAAYMFPVTAGIEGEVRLDWSGQDDTWSDVSNTLEVPNYDIANIRFTIRGAAENQWRVSLYGRNLSNDEILVWNGGTSVFGTVNSYARPRNFGLEATYEF